MANLPTITAGYDWTAASNINLFIAAIRNRNYMLTNGNYGTIATVAAGADISSAAFIRSLQSWIEANYTGFCRMNVANINQPGLLTGDATRAALKYTAAEIGSTATAAIRFATDAGLNPSSTPSNWWDRKAPGVDTHGPMTAGDYIGSWIWADLAKALRALRLVRVATAPTWHVLKQSWREVPLISLPPPPPGLVIVAKGDEKVFGVFQPEQAPIRAAALTEMRSRLTGNSFTTPKTGFKVGNQTYERYTNDDQFSKNLSSLAALIHISAEIHWTTSARWPTGTGENLLFMNAGLTVTNARETFPYGYSPHDYLTPTVEIVGSQYFKKPPAARGGYAPIITLVNGWNCVYRKAETNLNTSGVAIEANITDPIPSDFVEWGNILYPPSSDDTSREQVRGWQSDAVDAYLLTDEA